MTNSKVIFSCLLFSFSSYLFSAKSLIELRPAREERVNLVLMGETTVGKTTLINRYTGSGKRNLPFRTIGIHVTKATTYLIDDKSKKLTRVPLLLWDTTGVESYFNVTKAAISFRQADGFILMHNEDLNNLSLWYKKIRDEGYDHKPILILKSIGSSKISPEIEAEEKKFQEIFKSKFKNKKIIFATVNLEDQNTLDSPFNKITKLIKSGN